MRKILGAIALALVLGCSSISAFAAAQSIVINGTVAEIPADMGEIIEQDDRTFVPIRFVSEQMGKVVKYDDNLNAAIILDGPDMYFIQQNTDNSYRITDPGITEETVMDTSAFIKEYENGGRMYIPIRFVSEAFGYEVGWDEATQTVYINDPAVMGEGTVPGV